MKRASRKEVDAGLRRALRSKDALRIERRFRNESVDGVVVALGDEWLLVHELDDGWRLDGWCAIRRADVTGFADKPWMPPFVRRVLAARKERPTAPRGIDVSSTEALLDSLERAAQLCMVFRERSGRDAVDVGRIVARNQTEVTLRALLPNGEELPWLVGLRSTALTRIDFGDAYLDALELGAPKRRARVTTNSRSGSTGARARAGR